ncbi:MAG: hypothetical protein JOZ41_20935 [Chloroflexi bacterium]|nr:hypothetical protein [Chloroflexota bacterium]
MMSQAALPPIAAIARQHRRWITSPRREMPGWLRLIHTLVTASLVPAYGPIIPPVLGRGLGPAILFYLAVTVPSTLGAGIAWRATHDNGTGEQGTQYCTYCHEELGKGPGWCHRCGAWRANPLSRTRETPRPVSTSRRSSPTRDGP